MTWSAFALFLVRRTEYAFSIGHFLIIFPFHSLLATFQVSISLIFDLFWIHCFGCHRSKVAQGSKLRNKFMHSTSLFSFHFLSFSISFPKLTIFTILRLYVACKMWKITALTWEISSWRLVETFHISAFPMYYSPYHWIGELEITKLKNIYLLRIEKKEHKNKHRQKDINEMEWHKMDYLIFSAMRMRRSHQFCASNHHNVPYEKKQELNKGSEPWNECHC